MSLAMRQARFSAVGDPGLLGFLGSAVSSIGKAVVGGVGGFLTGGPAGAVLGAAGSVIGRKPISVAKMTPTGNAIFNQLAILKKTGSSPMFPTTLPQAPPSFSGVSVGGPGGLQVGTSRPGVGATAMAPVTTGALVGAGQGTPCTSGYHYNKSRYYSTRYGVIEKGSVCVKNRRRNPLNPRALSRAMSRVKSAQKAVRCLQLFAGPAARASSKSRFGGKNGRKSCRGCK